jgi:endo-1,3-1,4-beta-glycanase ExoK
MGLAAKIGIGAIMALAIGGLVPGASAQASAVDILANNVANTGEEVGDAFIVDLTRGYPQEELYVSDFDVRSDWSLMFFRDDNVGFTKKGLVLRTRKNGDEELQYTSAEVQRVGFYGYGRYEVVMRASGAPGVVSSFFTHTGEFRGDPHDEVDVEILGRTPRSIHLNYFNAGGSDAANIDLWFDASEAEHLYAFEWLPGSIVWYVDGVKLREVNNSTAAVPVPTTASRVLVNTWVGNRQTEEWLGTPEFHETSALYRCISHVPVGQVGKQCSDVFTPPPVP